MASFDGALYIKDQIRSIINQDFIHWHLYVRDDGSSDDTVKLIRQFVANDSRIVLLKDERGHLGAAHNFEILLNHAMDSQEGYICFADQDDVWRSDKISTLLSKMLAIEKYGSGLSALVYSDLCVTNHQMVTIHPSFMEYQYLRHEQMNPHRVLLVQNYVTGCALMINRALIQMVLPLPKEALMHDWWLALCAAVFGHIGYVDEALVKYRQHGNNEVGAKHLSDFLNPLSGQWRKRWLEGRDSLFQSMKQAEALAERIRKYDPGNPHLALVEAYAALQDASPVQRIKKIRQLDIHAQSHIRQALLLSRLLMPKLYGE